MGKTLAILKQTRFWLIVEAILVVALVVIGIRSFSRPASEPPGGTSSPTSGQNSRTRQALREAILRSQIKESQTAGKGQENQLIEGGTIELMRAELAAELAAATRSQTASALNTREHADVLEELRKHLTGSAPKQDDGKALADAEKRAQEAALQEEQESQKLQQALTRMESLQQQFPGAAPAKDGQVDATANAVAEIVKRDCQKLVDGQLLFQPAVTMQQGKDYPVFARLSRGASANMSEGLGGSTFTVVKEKVSCKVSLSLDAAEPASFLIEKVPADRKDDQVLEPDKYSQWDWRVTPRKHGSLHLLLYVTPMLYVDGIGEELKEFRQPPRVISVSPDFVYESRSFIKDNWAFLSVLLTAVFIPLFLWLRTGIAGQWQRWFPARKVFYELPPGH